MFSTLAIAVPTALALITVSVLSTLVFNWVQLQLLLMMPTCLLVVSFYLTEESPRWLMEAEQAVLWAARVNGLTDFSQIRAELCRIKESVVSQLGFSTKHTVLDIFLSKSMRIRSAIISCCWFVVISAYINMSDSESLMKDTVVQVIISIASVPILGVNYRLIKTWGRRTTLSFCMITMSVLASAQTVILVGIPSLFRIVNITAMLFLNAQLLTIYVYTVEIYPTALRCVGVSGAFMLGRIGHMLSPMIRDIKGVYSLISQLFSMTVTAVSLQTFGLFDLLLPETSALRAVDSFPHVMPKDKWKFHSPVRFVHKGKRKHKKRL
ncbi:hypothetical protein HPB47_004659 [Ixodes persulcatus]|uniref:Uncharacterized protein n=1 Tax=Ixodes persulcatus TaxID=34615 RepID=A0AC60PF17_IXOPE|nr:hypothetical protein HPB47_004659 [Ixodes persulcatus]